MNKNIKAGAQGGFTLIELIVVITILGILAATALPKFVSLGADARAASVQAAKGALAATSGMVHGKFLIDPVTYKEKVTVENVTVNMTEGYPTADTAMAQAAGLGDGSAGSDYTVDAKSTGILVISPKSAAKPDSCNVTYKTAAAGAAPVITATVGDCS